MICYFYYVVSHVILILKVAVYSAMSAVLVGLPVVLRRICTTVDRHLF